MSELWESVRLETRFNDSCSDVERNLTIRNAVQDACEKSLALAAQARAYNDALAYARAFSQPDPSDDAWFRAIDAADDAWALVARLLDEGTDDA